MGEKESVYIQYIIRHRQCVSDQYSQILLVTKSKTETVNLILRHHVVGIVFSRNSCSLFVHRIVFVS